MNNLRQEELLHSVRDIKRLILFVVGVEECHTINKKEHVLLVDTQLLEPENVKIILS